MAKVVATVVLEIDETDKDWIEENAEQFLQQSLIEQAPSNQVEDNAIIEKPVFDIEEVYGL